LLHKLNSFILKAATKLKDYQWIQLASDASNEKNYYICFERVSIRDPFTMSIWHKYRILLIVITYSINLLPRTRDNFLSWQESDWTIDTMLDECLQRSISAIVVYYSKLCKLCSYNIQKR
jgi:hypothetical protein